jgi:hypothetical protein
VILIAVENYGEWSLVTSSGSRLAGTGVREEISVFCFFLYLGGMEFEFVFLALERVNMFELGAVLCNKGI